MPHTCTHYHEMLRLRRDLHDELGPGLAGILIRADLLGSLLSEDRDGAEAMLRDLRREAATFMAEFRRVLANREPAELEGQGLAAALASLADRLRAVLVMDVEVDDDVATLDRDLQVAAFWIAKEAVTNVVKHAHATRCTVRVRVGAGLELSVRDNGRGGALAAGVGLTSMHDRAAELGGWCEVTDTGAGVAVTAQLPERWATHDRAA